LASSPATLRRPIGRGAATRWLHAPPRVQRAHPRVQGRPPDPPRCGHRRQHTVVDPVWPATLFFFILFYFLVNENALTGGAPCQIFINFKNI
jgi:hypothetical protein